MNEISKVKSHANKIVTGTSDLFTILEHEHLTEDIWLITVKNIETQNIYTFKNNGFEFYDFKKKIKY